MSPHTPGPWKVDRQQASMAVLGPDGFMIADCCILSIRPGAPTDERRVANARLIAAVPAMLKELERLHDKHGEQATADVIKKATGATKP